MKAAFFKVLLGTFSVLGLGLSGAMAQTTETRGNVITNTGSFTNVVINSTYTFSGAGTSGPNGGNFNLDGTTISNLNGLVPPVTLQLILTGISYTEQSVTGDGQIPSITFDLTPTLGNWSPGGNLPSMQVTLYASGPIANGVTDNNVVFSLANAGSTPDPVVWQPVDESNPGNGNEGTGGTWQETLTNLEPDPDSITFSGGSNFVPNSVQNQSFTFNGKVEVVYAAPEPTSLLLGVVAGGLFLVLYRRHNLRD
jgi:hypothetical protein